MGKYGSTVKDYGTDKEVFFNMSYEAQQRCRDFNHEVRMGQFEFFDVYRENPQINQALHEYVAKKCESNIQYDLLLEYRGEAPSE